MCRQFMILGLAAGLGACQTANTPPAISRFIESEPQVIRNAEGPPNAAPGSCWGRDVTPAVIETVTERVLLQPAELNSDGKVIAPAIYKSETRQQITTERGEIWFETPCPEALTADFVATLQRALAARGHYRASVTSEMDRNTRRAIRSYQQGEGLDSSILSLAAARKLGLVVVKAPTSTEQDADS